jgi:hypothetical protein
VAVCAVAGLVTSIGACGSDAPSRSATSAAGTSTAAPTGSDVTVTQGLRDVRYCEVIPSVTDEGTITTYVYNTLGQNFCPPSEWSQLTEDEVNAEFGSDSAELNGPRHWVLDDIQGSGASTTGETFTFGGIEMNLRATLTTPAGQPTVGNQFYAPNEVARDTIFTYEAGRPIFQLTDPAGNVYVMQSYAQIADRTLTIRQLPDLATALQLPDGWSYSSETLAEDLSLNSNGLATVVNDNLYNSYQKR